MIRVRITESESQMGRAADLRGDGISLPETREKHPVQGSLL